MNKLLIITLLFMLVISCQPAGNTSGTHEKYRAEIVSTEKNFEKMAADSGLASAFSFYVADSGVVNARDSLFIGKKAVFDFYHRGTRKGVSLKWTPDFVDVSSSGDLGYTYGKYTFSYKDSTGNEIINKGIFHTVWKRQTNGSWRFVWD